MALKDYQAPQKRVIKFPKGEFAVRGLNFSDISRLMASRKDELILATIEFRAFTEDGTDLEVDAVLKHLMAVAPDLLLDAIAYAADEPEATHIARALPPDVQINALLAIGELTFQDPGAVPDFLAGVTTILKAMVKNFQTVTSNPSLSTGF